MMQPKILTALQDYSFEKFISDAVAGVIVGIVAIPLAIAFAIASGVSPERGLFTAIVAGFLISLLGGSRVQIGGPTGAFVIIIYGIVRQHGYDGLVMATLLAGIFLILMGWLGLGAVIKFIPHPVIVGFTSGIAVIIFSSQVKDFFGIPEAGTPAEFFEKWIFLLGHIKETNFSALFVAAGTVAVIAFWPRISRRIPGSLVALIFFSVLSAWFHLPVETIGGRFGELPHTLPAPHIPMLQISMIAPMIQPAFLVAFLGAIESLLSAVVADGMIGGRHRSNMELVAQGVANIGSILFGGIPATGAIARTVTNIRNGGRTPVAGMIHALTIMIVMLFAAPLASRIPMACLAGVLIVVAYNMSEWRTFLTILRHPKSDVAVLVATFLLTVLVDLTVAIEIGMVLSSFLFMNRMAQMTHVKVFERELQDQGEEPGQDAGSKYVIPDGVEVYEINGPFFFAASHKFEEATRTVSKLPKVRILRFRHVPFMDSTGLYYLKEFEKKCARSKIRLILAGLQSQPMRVIRDAGLFETIGADNFSNSMQQALKSAAGVWQEKPGLSPGGGAPGTSTSPASPELKKAEPF